MAVVEEDPIASSVANGVTTSFPFSFSLRSAADLVVTGTLDGIVTTYSLGVHYTVSGVGGGSGSADFLSAPASGTIITRYRRTQLVRSTDYQDNGDLPADTLNDDFDRVWQALQEMDGGSRAPRNTVRVPIGETLTELPPAAVRADRLLGFDAAGDVAALPAGTVTTAEALAFVPAGAGAVPRTAQDKLRESVSVKDFGAAGDGVTDDTAAFLAAIGSGQLVCVPAGTYILSNAAWPAVVSMFGAGMGLSVLKWKANSASSSLMALSGVVNWALRDLTIDSNRQNQTDSTGYYGTIGGTISNGSRVRLERCEFINGRITDITLVGPTAAGEFAEVDITNSRFYDGLVGNATRAAQAVSVSEGIRLRFNHNKLRQPSLPASYGRGGVVMQRPGGSTSLAWGQFEAIGNEFENFGRQTLDRLGCLYVYSGSELTTITGNRFRNSVGTAITVKSDCGSTSVTGNVVNGHIDAAVAAICFFGQADTYTSSIGRDLVIVGNSVYGAQYQSIFVDGERTALADFVNVIIADNICDGGLRGIHFRNVDSLKIRGNQVSNTTGICIFGEDCSGDVDISGNTLTGGVVGLDILGVTSAARLSISGNPISNLTSTAIRLRSSVECFHITGNLIAGCGTAFDTRGATQMSSITGNRVRGETTAWDRTGTYGMLDWRDNITSVAVAFGTRSLTIATGAVTAFADWHYIDTEGAAATDDLDTINGGYEGRRLTLAAANNARDVVLKDGTGNLRLNGDFTLTHSEDTISLIYIGTVWREISRSDNTV